VDRHRGMIRTTRPALTKEKRKGRKGLRVGSTQVFEPRCGKAWWEKKGEPKKKMGFGVDKLKTLRKEGKTKG